MKNISLWYALVLVIWLVSSLVREGFESSPHSLFTDIANKKVLLLISRNGCVHCENLKPAWKKAAAKEPEKMVAIEINDTNSSNPDVKKMLSKLNVTGYPSMFEMDNGNMVTQYEGGRTEQDLLTFVSAM
jgi:thiol-disulfide isomerase/thioredoxin